MKKFLLTILPLVAALFLGACSGDGDGDGDKVYTLTVNVTIPEAYSWEDVTSETVIARNQLTGVEYTGLKLTDGVYTILLEPGDYNVNALFETADMNLSGQKMNVSVYSAIALTSIAAEESLTSPLVIKEFYSAMCKTPANKNYMYDQFVEIYNNSAFTQYLDNCLIARTEIAANTKTVLWGSTPEEMKAVAVSSYIAGWVGDGKTYPIEPGQSVVVAFQAQNHTIMSDDPATEEVEVNTNTIDLSKADYEIDITEYKSTYVANPDVPNLTIVAKSGTQSVNFAVLPAFGAGLVLAKVDNIEAYCDVNNEANWVAKPEGTDVTPYLMIRYKDIQDAVNVVCVTETQRTVALPAQVDAGMIYTSAMYNGKGFTRKVAETVNGRVVYKDTNNSAEDFEPEAKPTPGA